MRNSEGVLREWVIESEREIECVGVLREWEKEIETERCQSQKNHTNLILFQRDTSVPGINFFPIQTVSSTSKSLKMFTRSEGRSTLAEKVSTGFFDHRKSDRSCFLVANASQIVRLMQGSN